jgi:hypothetical protein
VSDHTHTLQQKRQSPGTLKVCRQTHSETQTESLLLHLPAELRNRFYEFALSGGSFEFKEVSPKLHRISKNDEPAIALLSACLQTHAEIATLLYTLNTFSFRLFDHLKDFASHFTQAQV